MNIKADTKTDLTAVAVEAAEDFGFAIEVNEAGLLRTYDPDDDYIDPDDDGDEGDHHRSSDGDKSDWVAPEIIIAACRTNAWERGFFDNVTWRKNIMAGYDASEAALEIMEEFRLLKKVCRLVMRDQNSVSNDNLDEIVRLVEMIRKDRAS
jgi:hypothetical protein